MPADPFNQVLWQQGKAGWAPNGNGPVGNQSWNGPGTGPGTQGPDPNAGLDPNTNPFLNPAGKGYYSAGTDAGMKTDPTSGKQYWDPGSGGTQRAQAVGDYSNYLMHRQGPNFVGQDQGGMIAARGQQQQALGLMRNLATGNGPSVAQAQTYGAMGQNIAAMNAASQGRGGAARAMGTGFAAGNQAAMAGANARAGEQANLMNAYGGGTNDLRNADISQYGTDTEQLSRGRDLATQQGILNAQTTLGIQGQEEQNELNNASFQQALYQLRKQTEDQNTQQNWNTTGTILKDEASVGAMSDRRAKTGIRKYGLMSHG